MDPVINALWVEMIWNPRVPFIVKNPWARDWVEERACDWAQWSTRAKQTAQSKHSGVSSMQQVMRSKQCGASNAKQAVRSEQCGASIAEQAVRSKQMSKWCERTSKLPSIVSFLPIAQRRLLIGLFSLTTWHTNSTELNVKMKPWKKSNKIEEWTKEMIFLWMHFCFSKSISGFVRILVSIVRFTDYLWQW